MALTQTANVFVPEIATRVATAEFPNRLAIGFAGTPFVVPFPPEADLGDEGNVVKFPRWNPMGEFADMTEGTPLVPETMSTALDTAPVIVGGKAVEVTDYATLASRGNPSEQAGIQIATLAGRYVDKKLIVEGETATLTVALAGTATYDAFISAIISSWGDKAFEQVGGLVVHSKVLGDLFKLTEFKSGDFSNVAQILAMNRNPGTPVGVLAGTPVYVSDRISVIAGAPNTYANLILKRGALGMKFQRTLLVERDRDILAKHDVIAADVRFAVHLLFADPSPVIKWTTQ